MISEELLKQIKPGVTVSIQDKFGNFKGLVIAKKHGREKGATFTVRATLGGVNVEKIYPIHSPSIIKVEILSTPSKRIRRSKLYFLRNLSRKKLKKKIGATI